jgi:hypothetical protein
MEIIGFLFPLNGSSDCNYRLRAWYPKIMISKINMSSVVVNLK